MLQYHQTLSGADPVILPFSLFIGHEWFYRALPPDITWYFSAEPEAVLLRADLVELSVEFEGRLEV
jgi:hypothetical protein